MVGRGTGFKQPYHKLPRYLGEVDRRLLVSAPLTEIITHHSPAAIIRQQTSPTISATRATNTRRSLSDPNVTPSSSHDNAWGYDRIFEVTPGTSRSKLPCAYSDDGENRANHNVPASSDPPHCRHSLHRTFLEASLQDVQTAKTDQRPRRIRTAVMLATYEWLTCDNTKHSQHVVISNPSFCAA